MAGGGGGSLEGRVGTNSTLDGAYQKIALVEGGFLSLFLAVGPAKAWQGWRWVPRGEGTPTVYLFFIFLVVGPTKRGGGLYSSFSSCGASLEMTGGVGWYP